MTSNFALWKFRPLTVIGKILITKTFGMSNLIYSMSILESNDDVLKKAQNAINNFIWGGPIARVKHKTLIAPYDLGGLCAPDLQSQNKALRLVWIGRLLRHNSWSMIAHHYFDKYGGLNFLLQCNYDTHYLNEIPKFYNEMLEYYNEITLTDGSQNIIWNNRNIKINNRPVYWKTWHNQGITYISDLKLDTNVFLTYDQFISKYNIKTNFLQYYGLINSVKKYNLSNSVSMGGVPSIRIIKTIEGNIIDMNKAKSKDFYKELILGKCHEPTMLNRLTLSLNVNEQQVYESLPLNKKSTSEPRLLEFQYKILNGYLAVGTTLEKWNIKSSNKCRYCNEEDTIFHCLFLCSETHKWIIEIQNYLRSVSINFENVNLQKYILGSYDEALNVLLLVIKHYIWKVRHFETKFNINSLLYEIHKRYLCDIGYMSSKRLKLKWGRYKTFVDDLKLRFNVNRI